MVLELEPSNYTRQELHIAETYAKQLQTIRFIIFTMSKVENLSYAQLC